MAGVINEKRKKMNINEKVYQMGVEPSVIREIFAFGCERAAVIGAENVMDFSIGNPSVPAPKEVQDTIIRIINNLQPKEYHSYTPGPGAPATRKAIADNLNKRFGSNFGPEDLYMTCGAAASLSIVLKTLIAKETDEIAVVIPFFPEYTAFIKAQGGIPVQIQPAEDLTLDIEKLKAAITPNTKAIIINSPNNPSGVIYPEANIKAACEVLKAKEAEYGHPIYIIADEPYRELVYTEEKVAFIPSIYDNTIICYSWSKSLSLPGERIGYIAVPKSVADYDLIIPAINGAGRVLGYVCAPSLFQQVVKECVDVMPDIEPYRVNRDLLYNALVEYGYNVAKPSGAFYMYIEAPDKDAEAFCEKAKQQDVLLVPGTGFGTPSYMRLSYCVEKAKVEKCLPVFKKLMEEYK